MSAIKFVGLDNFAILLKDPKFWSALRVSFVITVVCTLLGTAGATILAELLEKVADRAASLLRVIFFLPAVTSVVVINLCVLRQLYSTGYGYFNALLTNLGLPPQEWLADPDLALWSLIIMLIWAGLGWDALIITAGLRAIPDELYDAAVVTPTVKTSESFLWKGVDVGVVDWTFNAAARFVGWVSQTVRVVVPMECQQIKRLYATSDAGQTWIHISPP